MTLLLHDLRLWLVVEMLLAGAVIRRLLLCELGILLVSRMMDVWRHALKVVVEVLLL